jgi:hypothetical protein
MKLDLNDENFIAEVEEFTGNSLHKKEDIKKIIKIVTAQWKEKEFEELTFTAKYVCGMMRIVKNVQMTPEVQNIDHVKEDLNENIKKAIEQLSGIIAFGDNDVRDYFEKMYLSLTAQNFSNLNQFLSDLEAVKKYLNYLKRLS